MFDYNSPPLKTAFTVRVRYKAVGELKPMEYQITPSEATPKTDSLSHMKAVEITAHMEYVIAQAITDAERRGYERGMKDMRERAAKVLGAGTAVLVVACAAAALIVFRHRSNLARLRLGTERRIGSTAVLAARGVR